MFSSTSDIKVKVPLLWYREGIEHAHSFIQNTLIEGPTGIRKLVPGETGVVFELEVIALRACCDWFIKREIDWKQNYPFRLEPRLYRSPLKNMFVEKALQIPYVLREEEMKELQRNSFEGQWAMHLSGQRLPREIPFQRKDMVVAHALERVLLEVAGYLYFCNIAVFCCPKEGSLLRKFSSPQDRIFQSALVSLYDAFHDASYDFFGRYVSTEVFRVK